MNLVLPLIQPCSLLQPIPHPGLKRHMNWISPGFLFLSYPFSCLPTHWMTLLDNGCHGPKSLFLRAEHVSGDVAEQGGLEEIFSNLMSLPACHNSGPFGNGITHMFLYLCEEKKKSPWERWLRILGKHLNCRKL